VTHVTPNQGQAIQVNMVDPLHEIELALRASFLFPVLSSEERQRFLSSGRPKSWRADQVIFSMGDPGNSMMVVKSGKVRISYPAADGRAMLLCDLGAGGVFGEIALLDGGNRSADAIALTDCALILFPRKAFTELLEGNSMLVDAVLKLVCGRLRTSDERMAELAFSDLSSRLAKTLLARARALTKTGQLCVDDSQSALAGFVGGSRENVNRYLRRWVKAGFINVAEGRITVLNPDALARQTVTD
jgi:CRP/FNR family transcriptional regulator, cyclic AMP receptor protein